jgi:phosphoenolpyruvate carboxykinase (GTP)
MELRSHHEVEAIETPTGFIPKYEDLKGLFREVLSKDYPKEDYINQFSVRITENLAKIERIQEFYKTKVADTPQILFEVLEEQRKRLIAAQEKYGDYISPL